MKHFYFLLAIAVCLQGCTPKAEVPEDSSCTSVEIAGTCPATNVGYAIDYHGRLVCFSLSAPQTLAASVTITGLIGGDSIQSIDFRPNNSLLYAVGDSGQLYTMNTATGAATAVGTPFVFAGSPYLIMDFNPEVDSIRVVTQTGENRRYNPDTSALVSNDTNLAYAGGDINAGATARLSALAYSNNVVSGTPTVLYGIDSNLKVLVTLAPANAGILNTVGNLGFSPTDIGDLDIKTVASLDIAYAVGLSGATGMRSDLYTVNLSTGLGTRVGTLGGCRVWNFAVGL